MKRKRNITLHIDLVNRLVKNRVILDKGYITPCWNWVGSTNSTGYGWISFNNTMYQVHRIIAYICLCFDLKSTIDILHKCDNKRCFNPSHIFFGNDKDNAVDRATKGRSFNSTKTHCKYGHEFTEENTFKKDKRRICIKCNQLRMKKFQSSDSTAIER